MKTSLQIYDAIKALENAHADQSPEEFQKTYNDTLLKVQNGRLVCPGDPVDQLIRCQRRQRGTCVTRPVRPVVMPSTISQNFAAISQAMRRSRCWNQ